ncbi:MAG TPA: CPBP family intramembrane glutamic endopeptidase [Pirellulaceae bacterium]|jgi:membrane protease YdiL (CAAX protease family)|nr:CPBP family intramembrane glutamic endopeptidase [Pirellulaceae bacterium]
MPVEDDQILGLHRLTWLAVTIQGVLALVALGWALLLGLDPLSWFPLEAWVGSRALITLATTLAAAAPPVAAFFWMRTSRLESVVRFRDDVRQRLIPLFGETRFADWLVISLTAGLTEELAFRGALFYAFVVWVPGSWGVIAAVLLPSLLFGALHALNRFYFLATTIAGVYFALIVWWSGDLWAAALAHFLYDLVVFVVEGPSARSDLFAAIAAPDLQDDGTEAGETVPARNEATATGREGEGP